MKEEKRNTNNHDVKRQSEQLPNEISDPILLKPSNYTDVDQAAVFAQYYGKHIRFSRHTGFMVYDGVRWVESETKARDKLQDLTQHQLDDAIDRLKKAKKSLEETGADLLMKNINAMNEVQKEAYNAYLDAKNYKSFVLNHRNSANITATLKEVCPMIEIDINDMDSDAFLLNTPGYTIDLRKGSKGIHEHNPGDYITKCTSVTPGNKGKIIWDKALNVFFCGDKNLIQYAQLTAGTIVIGQIFLEQLIIAFGDGRNGKSTFWNSIGHVLGDYSGHISADALTVGCRRNIKPELAEAKGKRLLIAAEMEEGMRLNTSIVKQVSSTDPIFAEKKYKAPFSFIPSHTVVLYTNHLPKVGAIDPGTWRRLVIVPFNAIIEGNSDIKNYADYLFNNAGPAILSWIVEGAKKAIALGCKIPMPECVIAATKKYREDSDWLGNFIADYCDVSESNIAKSGDLYTAYKDYCTATNEYVRSTTDFYTALDFAGFARKKTNKGSFVYGLSLRNNP